MNLTKLISDFNMLNEKNFEYTLEITDDEKSKGFEHVSFKSYKLVNNGREFFVRCPIAKLLTQGINGENENKYIKYIPSLLIPRKKFPANIYMYAVKYYLSTNYSMRKVSNHVCEKFNLKTFSHSTICRLLQKLSNTFVSLKDVFAIDLENVKPSKVYLWEKWDADKQEKMRFISKLLEGVLSSTAEIVDKLCVKYFKNTTGKFLF